MVSDERDPLWPEGLPSLASAVVMKRTHLIEPHGLVVHNAERCVRSPYTPALLVLLGAVSATSIKREAASTKSSAIFIRI